jgi:hypothetical protein
MTEQGVAVIQSYAISLGQLIHQGLTLLPDREWRVETIGL